MRIQYTEGVQLALRDLAQQRQRARNGLLLAMLALVAFDVLCMLVVGRFLDVTPAARAKLLGINDAIITGAVVFWVIGASLPVPAATLGLHFYWGAQIVAVANGAMPWPLFGFELLPKLMATSWLVPLIAEPAITAGQLRTQGIEIAPPMAMPRARTRRSSGRSGD